MTQTTIYTVTGMTCGHCVSSVTEEVQETPASSTSILLETGALTINSAEPVDAAAVKAAVEEQLRGPRHANREPSEALRCPGVGRSANRRDGFRN